MLNKIIEFSIRNKLIVGLFVIALTGYGIYEVTKLPIDAVPDITNNQVQVITVAPSYGANDIERLVTFPIEQANTNISGLKEIRSFSRFGLSLVTIVFDDETDIYWARQQVAERLQKIQSQIPQGIGTPELGPVSTGLGEIYQYTVRAKEGYENRYNETDLRTIQDWLVRRQLLGVKGVAEVSSFGGKLKQFEVAIDLNKLQSFNVTISDVFHALEKNNQNTGGTYIEKGPTVLFIRSEGLITEMKDIEDISIKATETGKPIFIRDVARVNIGFATRYGAMCYNDKGEVSGAVVMMLKGANSSDVIKRVKDRVEQIQKTLPEGVLIDPFLDRTKMVNNAIGTVEQNLLEGALIVIFVLVLFLGNMRAGLLVASVIPLSMLVAIILMNTFGVSGNLMSLGALDFGLIVDGAVIIVEAVMHQLSHRKKFKIIDQLSQEQMDNEVALSASKMMNSAVFGQVIILIVYLPIFTLQGIEGKMFKPMAQTVAFALLGAFILSLTYVPMMSALFLSKKTKHKPTISDKLMVKIEKGYQSALAKALHYPKMILSFVLILFAVAIFILSKLGGEFIPALEEGDFALEMRVLPGSNLNTTKLSAMKAAGILKQKFPEVIKVVTKIGSGEVPTDPMPLDAADVMIILKDKSEWTSAETFPELAEKMGKELEVVLGTSFSFQFPVQMRFNELMTGAKQDVVCKIFGENLDTLASYAQKLGGIVEKVDGAKNLFVEPVTGMPQIIINFNRATIAQYNLTISDINGVINTAFSGQSTGQLFEGEKRFDIVVRMDDEKRKSIEDVKNILIPTSMGTQVPLYQLANVSIKNGPNQIQREDAKRRIIVGFNVGGRDVQTIVQELQQKVGAQIQLPSGYYITYGGAFENLNEAKQRLIVAVPVSLILIFLLLFFAFHSVKQSLLIYSAIPLSAIGGIFFLAIRGMPFSISGGVGFIALFGVAVLNGIVLIAEFNRLKREGLQNLSRIVLMGTKVRLRPVMMTAFVASLGFLPMALSNGAGAEVQRPLATVVIGGLMIATFLTLFLLPILYIISESSGMAGGKVSKIVVSIMVIFLFGSVPAGAQVPINLQAAIDTALQNNLSVKNERLKEEYQKKIVKTSASIPQANILGEYGQINSYYNDSRFGASQAFNFPTVYIHQKQLLTEEWSASIINTTLKEAEIKKMVYDIFYTFLYLTEKEKLLLKNDSIYKTFLEKANSRFEKGERNILEKTTAETQRGAIAIQLIQLKQDIETVKVQLRFLLNATTLFEPIQPDLKLIPELSADQNSFTLHPMVKILEQQQKISFINRKVEKAKLLPDINIGYYNMSMLGTGSDNRTYSSSARFQSVQIGVGIPLFFGAQKAKLSASIINQQISDNAYQLKKKQLENEYKSLLARHQSNLSAIDYFETTALKNAQTIFETADRQFINGDINFLDWVMITNQALHIQSEYIDAIKNLNETIIQINFLNTK